MGLIFFVIDLELNFACYKFDLVFLLRVEPYSRLGLLRLWIISYGTVTVTVYGYRPDTAVYGYFLTLVNTVNTVHFCKVTVFTVFSVYFCLRLCTVMYGYVRLCTVTAVYRGIYGIYGY